MAEIEIRLNGESFRIREGATVSELLRELELAEDRVAVELDRAILRRPQWAGRRLESGSAVEIVQLVGGG
jgi:thiamine biosynthesis protein ThiS